MLGKMVDLVLAVCIMLLLPAWILFCKAEQLEAWQFSARIESLGEVIQKQGYIGTMQLHKLEELQSVFQQEQIEVRYYPENDKTKGVLLTLENCEKQETVRYQGEAVYPLQTGKMIEIRVWDKIWSFLIRDGLAERVGAGAVQNEVGRME
ncbi:MAG: hypothetical protein IJY09_09235 [Lachnospiraceae bacterium]|nr:hypothetical protein [Lachnospiraceae bacterium]